MTFIEKVALIDRLDQLIRLKATGKPIQLAEKLCISKRSVHNLIEDMRTLGAEIYYCPERKSYCYETEVTFICRFQPRNTKSFFGGFNITQSLYNHWESFYYKNQYQSL